MKCCSRSTKSFASGSLWLLLSTVPLFGAPSTPFGASGGASLRASAAGTSVATSTQLANAIETAVRARVGRASTVSVTSVTGVRLVRESTSLVAVPDPSGRIGAPVRFVLASGAFGARTRVGEVTAIVEVNAPAVRASRAIARGDRIAADAVAVVATDLNGLSLRPLLSLEDARGARVTHDIAEGALVTRSDIVPEPIVKAGDVVRAHVHVGAVDLVGSGIAAESGMKDEVIRVINQESRHAFRARVVGSGDVEVVDVR